MQTEGGYRYPNGYILLALSALSFVATTIVWYSKPLLFCQITALFLGLEGTSLLASSYTPVGLVPPQGNLWSRFKWLFETQKAVTVRFDQRMFYGGLLCLFLSYIVGAYAV